MSSQVYDLNMIPGYGVKPRIGVSQYDSDNREITFVLYNGDDAYDVTGKPLTIEGTKSDGTAFSYSVIKNLSGSVAGNRITWKPVTQMTAIAENVNCELVVWDTNGSRIGSQNFVLMVEEAGLQNADVSQTDLPGLVESFSEAADTLKAASQAATNAANAATAEAQTSRTELESIRTTLQQASDNIVSYHLSGTVLTITTQDYVNSSEESTEGGA